MRRTLTRLALRLAPRLTLCLALGLLTTIASALALALWMPLEMVPRHASYHFVAGNRAWNAVLKSERGVHHIWWSELSPQDMMPPAPPAEFAKDSLKALLGIAPKQTTDPKWPTTPEGWVEFAREDLRNAKLAHPLRMPEGAPSWGTFAGRGSAPPHIAHGSDHGYGWPLPALWYRVHGAYVRNYSFPTGIQGGQLVKGELSARSYDFRAVPYLPHYPGLLLNTALYASLFALLLFAPPTFRRRRRLRRGHCPHCGYDIQHNRTTPCPECGHSSTPLEHAKQPEAHRR